MVSKNKSYLQLSHTKEWVPRPEALDASMLIYSEFASNLACMEDLAILSSSLRSSDPELAIKRDIHEDVLDRLVRRDYFVANSLGSFVSRLTIRSQVAANMVVPEIEDGTISGYLSEPFVGRDILAELHSTHLRNIDERRKKLADSTT